MTRNAWVVCFLVVFAAFLLTNLEPAAATQAQPKVQSGRYLLSAAGDSAVMLDTESGKSWYLHVTKGSPPRPTWIAIMRQIDGQAAAGERRVPDQLTQQLFKAELALGEAKRQFGNQHPRVRELQREVDMVKKMIGAQ